MITKITILSNGSVAPNKPIALGYKYESVGDILEFDIPTEYTSYHHYLAFYMKKHDVILLPVNKKDKKYQFTIGTTITQNAGTYEIIFLATESKIENNDIDNARKVFVSNTMYGVVVDNFLKDPVSDEDMDPNIEFVWNQLLDLQKKIEDDLSNDAYRGAAYIPDVDENGVLSWERSDKQNIMIPEPKNITGPTGPYYIPRLQEGVFFFEKSLFSIPDVDSVNIYSMVKEVSDAYLEGNLEGISSAYLDAHLEEAVEKSVNNKFRWEWDDDNQIFYIYTEGYNPEGE